MSDLDTRLHAYRSDIADVRLEGRVDSSRYVEGDLMRITTPFADLSVSPEGSTTGLDMQLLHGHDVRVFDTSGSHSFVQSETCGYVGYVLNDTLSSDLSHECTHMVLSPRTYIYSDLDIKSARLGYRSMGSKLSISDFTKSNDMIFGILSDGGYVVSKHVFDVSNSAPTDYVAVGETLLHTPYLWGGNTGFGLDCSGLLYLCYLACGSAILRDTYMQVSSVGSEVAMTDLSHLRRGDIVFWEGHVGIMSSSDIILHSNAFTMNVALEPLSNAISRIEPLYGSPVCVRRP